MLRLRASGLVGSLIAAAADLLRRWDAPLNGKGVAMLLATVLQQLLLERKHSSRKSRKL